MEGVGEWHESGDRHGMMILLKFAERKPASDHDNIIGKRTYKPEAKEAKHRRRHEKSNTKRVNGIPS